MLAGTLTPVAANEYSQIRLLDPRFTGLVDWANSLYTETGIGELPRLDAFQDWREWADRLAALPEFEKRDIPRPDGFLTWEDWAERVYGAFMS